MKKIYFISSLLLVIVWMVVIFFLSEMPSDESNGTTKKIANKIIQETIETSSQEKNSVIQDKVSKIKANERNDLLENVNFVFRKFAHAGVYLVLSILLLNLFLQIRNKLDFKFVSLCIASCFLYACTDEFHQLFVDGRTGQFLDVIIDTAGASIGTMICYFCIRHIEIKRTH